MRKPRRPPSGPSQPVQDIEHEAVLAATQLIRSARQSADLTYGQLALRMGAHHYLLRRLEDPRLQRKGPTLATLMRIAKACDRKLKLTLE